MTLHQERTHPTYVEGCLACRVGSILVAPSAMPTRQSEVQRKDFAFRENFAAEFHNGDREAYRRLRANGVQPPRIAGSAHLERHAATRYEIESGQIAADQKALDKGLRVAEDCGFDPLTPSITEKAAG